MFTVERGPNTQNPELKSSLYTPRSFHSAVFPLLLLKWLTFCFIFPSVSIYPTLACYTSALEERMICEWFPHARNIFVISFQPKKLEEAGFELPTFESCNLGSVCQTFFPWLLPADCLLPCIGCLLPLLSINNNQRIYDHIFQFAISLL